MFERNRRVVEAAKSLLIILLSLSALYLAGRAILYDKGGESGVFTGEESYFLSATEPMGNAGVSRPVRMAVVNADGRYAVQYDTAGVDELFDGLGDLLGEALDSAAAAAPVGRESWEQALLSRGVYYDFPGSVPLSLVSAWLGEGETVLSAQISALVLAAEDGSELVRLYYVDADTGLYYACDTAAQFRQRLDGYIPNGALFAFQRPERYDGVDQDTLILPNVPAPAIYEGKAAVNLEDSAVLDALLNVLSFDPQPNAIYPAADGWNVRDGEDSLRLTAAGTIYYHGAEGSDRYHISDTASRAEMVEATGELVRQAMTPYTEEGRVYLSEAVENGESWTLTYFYTLSGAEVQLGQEGWCAHFTIQNGQIREYVLKLRRYEKTEQTAVLLPEYQAMHAMQAMDAEGRQLLLRYYDGGAGMVAPTWIAR